MSWLNALHIINGKRRNSCAGQRFHFNAGFGFYTGAAMDNNFLLFIYFNIHLTVFQP